MKIQGLERILGEHRLFAGLDPEFLSLLAGCATNRVFPPGARLAQFGAPVDKIYLVREGNVAMSLSAPGRGRVRIQTIGAGEVLGLSWLVPPYKWTSDAETIGQVRAVEMDADCMRAKCEADPAIGYAVLKRFVSPLVDRLHAARLQMLDVYGTAR
jgi:CRP/FNR family cyclic AMP-dependent transcriptional regulator